MIDEPLFMRPKNWWRHQHYQDGRSNKWIKNFLDLDEPGSKFAVLSLADQGRLQKLWRLAAHLPNGCIPLDEKYIRAHLGDKRFPIASHLVTNWFAVGTQMELKKAAQREKRSSKTPQKSTLEQRSKSKEVRKNSLLLAPEPVPGWDGLPIDSEKEQELAKILVSLKGADDQSLDALRDAATGVAFGRCRKVRESIERRPSRTFGVGYAVNALRSEAADAA